MNALPPTSSTTAAAAAGSYETVARDRFGRPDGGWRLAIYRIIFEAETPAGRWFDILLIAAIVASVGIVIADSVDTLSQRYGRLFDVLEWTVTLLFTVEYVVRLACVRRPWRYATSFYGIVDLLSILPTYVALLVPQAELLLDVRILRLVRVLRVFKLAAYFGEFRALADAFAASRRKILVFLSIILMVVLLMGTLMYVVEGPANGYTSIPAGIYWAIVTLTTVGYGDITPHTTLGRMIASLMMLLGWGILAVPTGIVTAEMTARRFHLRAPTTRTCPECLTEGHEPGARFCKDCGARLAPEQPG
jgi:voltage-gated potassium channel